MPLLGVFGQGSAAKLYLPVKVVQASSATTGYGVNLHIGTNSFDGNAINLAASGTTANLPGFIGVAANDIASTAFGLAQCWGFAASVYMSQYGTSVTVNQGNCLVPGAEAGGLGSTVSTYLNSGFKFIVASNTPATVSMAKTANYCSGLVRAL